MKQSRKPSKSSKKTIKTIVAPKSLADAVPRVPAIRAYLGDDEMIVDNFAGGGGASSGVTWVAGRSPDIAINHDPEAIAMHAANHPETKHYIEDVWQVDPEEACQGRPVGLAWFSPTCTHFSKAKGTALDESSVKIRGLAWVAVRWAAAVSPRIICLENVEEFQKWGPLHRTHTDGCTGRGATCRKACRIHKPIKEREGSLFRAWVSRLEKLGYKVEWRLMRACDYGAPTTRRRLFLVARRDGKSIMWPEPTHGPTRAKPYRTAAECIDWDVPCPSIFERDRPLADKTLARIARGIQKFVLDNPRPFIVPATHGDSGGKPDTRTHSVDEPLRTLTTRGAQYSIAVPYLVHRSNGERPEVIKPDGTVIAGQAPRIYDIEQPLGTIVAQGQKHAACVALLIKHNGGNNDAHGSSGQYIDRPMDTLATHNTKSLTVASLVKMRGTSEAHVNASGHSLDQPMPTVTASGTHIAAVHAFLVRYNGQSEAQSVDKPAGTLTTKDRYSLVTVTIAGEEYIVADIGMRMLTPRELYRAQGFKDWSATFRGTACSTAGGTESLESDGIVPSAKTPTSLLRSESEPAKRVVVRAHIDCARSVLELRSLAKSSSAVGSVETLGSYPLASSVVASVRALAPTSTCEAREAPTGRAGVLANSASTSRARGSRCATESGDETMRHVSAVGSGISLSLDVSPGRFTTSVAGPSFQNCDSLLRTLSSCAAHAIASSIRDGTLVGNSFDVELVVSDQYLIDCIYEGKPLTKTAQIRMVGNSVPPQMAEVVARAQLEVA